MVIINENSILKKLPIEFGETKIRYLDAICITLEMIQEDYHKLEELLNLIEKSQNRQRETIMAFNLVWGIIDKTSRLIDIQKNLKGIKNIYLDKINSIREFRNTLQHLDERIENLLLNNKLPFYGSISWFQIENDKIITKMIVSGIVHGINTEFIYPDILQLNEKINQIILHSVNRKEYKNINISELINTLSKFSLEQEKQIQNIVNENQWELCDWTNRKEIFVKFVPE